MVQRPNGLRIYLNDQQRGKPRRPSAGCFRPPSKQTSTTHFLKKKKNYFVPFGCFEAEGYVFFVVTEKRGAGWVLMVVGGEGRGGGTPHAKFPLSLGHMRPVSPPSSSHHHLFSSSVKNRKEGDDMSCGCDTVSFTLWPSDGREQVAATCRKRVFPSLLPAAASVHHQHLRVLGCVLCVCVPSKTTTKHTLLLLLLQVVKASFESICGSGPVYFLLL